MIKIRKGLKMKKAVLITGSARRNSNTKALADSFEKAAKENDISVERIDTYMLNLGPCHGCDQCFKNGRGCAYNDDFNKYVYQVMEADAIVISCPVYWYTMPACVKAFIDKFYAIYVGGRDFKGKKWALMSCCEADEPETFDGLLFALDKSFELMGAESAGKILLTGVCEAGDIYNTDGLVQAEKLAAHLAETLYNE